MLALDIQNLNKTYPNGCIALKDINLTVKEGDFFALLGANGAGKTTLIGIIGSLVKKSSGKFFVFGHDFDTQPQAVKSLIGLVPQEFNLSVFESAQRITTNQGGYYGLSPKIAKQRAEKYLKQLELWDKRNQRIRMLSGGMKRRLMVAKALVNQPKLLILDEPTAGIDIEIRQQMWALLRELNANGTTIILTTHYLEEAENLCRDIAIIDHGEIIINCKMSALLSQMQTETFILYLKNPLSEEPVIPGYPCKLVEKNILEVELAESKTMNNLFNTLSLLNIEVSRMKNKHNRLEEFFMRLINEENGSH